MYQIEKIIHGLLVFQAHRYESVTADDGFISVIGAAMEDDAEAFVSSLGWEYDEDNCDWYILVDRQAVKQVAPDVGKENNSLREILAAYAHKAWSEWMKYLFSSAITNKDGSITIPKNHVSGLKFQMRTPYDNLPEKMKPSDRDEADKMIAIINAKSETTTSESL